MAASMAVIAIESRLTAWPFFPAARASLALDVGGLDYRPPFLDLGLVIGDERLRRLLLARRNLLAEVGEPLAHARVRERRDHRGIEPGDDASRRALGHPERMPDRDVQSRRAGLVDRRNLGRRRQADLVGHRNRLNRSRAHRSE